MVRKLFIFVLSLIYGHRHVNTRHIPPETGQVWRNGRWSSIKVVSVSPTLIHVIYCGPNLVAMFTHSPETFSEQIREGRFWLESRND